MFTAVNYLQFDSSSLFIREDIMKRKFITFCLLTNCFMCICQANVNAALFKKNTITKENSSSVNMSVIIYYESIINYISDLNTKNPQFVDIEVPESLKKEYTQNALMNFFNNAVKRNHNNILKIFQHGNWSWSTYYIGNDYIPKRYYIEVTLHNSTDLSYLNFVTLEVTGVGSYNLKCYKDDYSLNFGVASKTDGKFISEINYQTYQKMRNKNLTAKLTRLYWNIF